MNIFRDIEQGTDEWKLLRKGKPTASNFSSIVTASKCELSKSADGYINDLIAQTFCPDWEPFEGNYWTKRGNELEPQARLAFQVATGYQVDQVGFVLHDNRILGCSPDGFVMDGGEIVAGLEIKCPAPNTHVEWMRAGVLPDKYKQQVHGSMIVTGIRQWHFWAYHPAMKPLHVLVTWDSYTDAMVKPLMQFCDLYRKVYAETVNKLTLE